MGIRFSWVGTVLFYKGKRSSTTILWEVRRDPHSTPFPWQPCHHLVSPDPMTEYVERPWTSTNRGLRSKGQLLPKDDPGPLKYWTTWTVLGRVIPVKTGINDTVTLHSVKQRSSRVIVRTLEKSFNTKRCGPLDRDDIKGLKKLHYKGDHWRSLQMYRNKTGNETRLYWNKWFVHHPV